MTHVSLLALALIVGGAVPLAWSCVLAAARAGAGVSRWQRIIATERAEQLMLTLMIAPIFLGLAFIVVAVLAPAAVPALPPIVRIVPQTLPAPAFVPQVAAHHIDWAMLLTRAVVLLYLAGVLCLLARFVRARHRLRKILENAVDANHVWGDGVGITEAQVPPFASGRTRIILPRSLIRHLSPDQVDMVVRHEQAHLNRRDPARFLAYALVEIALWFNPVIRRQVGRCRLAAEFACDRAAMSSAPARRKAYAQSLVLALKHGAGDAMFCAPAVVPSGNLGDYHMRMIEIMQPTAALGKLPVRAPLIAALMLSGPVIFLQATLAGAAVQHRPAIGATPVIDRIAFAAPSPRQAKVPFASKIDIVSPAGHPVPASPAPLVVIEQPAGFAHGEGSGAVHLIASVDQASENVPQPRGDPANWATVDDYPPSALREGRTGTTAYRVGVSAEGRVTGCTITASSGTPVLDSATCTLVTRRARFNPVLGDGGQATSSIFDGSINWHLPQ